jgi:hypothetical protein
LSAYTFFGGVLDIFLSCVLWFITDIYAKPYAIKIGNTTYAMLDTIKQSHESETHPYHSLNNDLDFPSKEDHNS